MKNNHGFSNILISFIILILGFVGYFVYNYSNFNFLTKQKLLKFEDPQNRFTFEYNDKYKIESNSSDMIVLSINNPLKLSRSELLKNKDEVFYNILISISLSKPQEPVSDWFYYKQYDNYFLVIENFYSIDNPSPEGSVSTQIYNNMQNDWLGVINSFEIIKPLYTEEKNITENIIKPQELEFKGLNNCSENECKNLEVQWKDNQIKFLDKDFNKLYTTKGIQNGQENIKFDKNFIYFSYFKFNESNPENNELKIYSLNIYNGEIIELMETNDAISDYLVVNNTIYYSAGSSCVEVCQNTEESYSKKIYTYNLKTKEITKLNTKNLTDSGYKIDAAYYRNFSYESGRINIYKLDNNRLTMSFGQLIQPAEWFFYFDLETKQTANIDGNTLYGGPELTIKKKELGSLSQDSKLFIRNGNFEVENN